MTKKLKENDYYVTSDLACATAISLSFPIEAIDRQNSRKVEFLFTRNNELDKLVEAYWRCELRIEPQKYFNQLRVVKARLYEGKKND